jgi:SAM-dependent methyltransferase
MDPNVLGKKYDKIATWWQSHHENGQYGVRQAQKALQFLSGGGNVLDVGCGAGGRLIEVFDTAGLTVTGVDVSQEMVRLAKAKHLNHIFKHQDICTWQPNNEYELVFAWDSLFHVPLSEQAAVIKKLCNCVAQQGVFAYTFGHGDGEHEDTWRDDTFYYSSLGINKNLALLMDNGLTPVHVELDQYPERHVFVVAQKL